jgi:hypothetical protein
MSFHYVSNSRLTNKLFYDERRMKRAMMKEHEEASFIVVLKNQTSCSLTEFIIK